MRQTFKVTNPTLREKLWPSNESIRSDREKEKVKIFYGTMSLRDVEGAEVG